MSRDVQQWYALRRVRIPTESYGRCKNAKRCNHWRTVLGDDLCVDCYDRGSRPREEVKG